MDLIFLFFFFQEGDGEEGELVGLDMEGQNLKKIF